MKTILFLMVTLIFTTFSCSSGSTDNGSITAPTIETKTEIINKIQGHFSTCAASQLYPGFFESNTVDVSGATYNFTATLSPLSDCSINYSVMTNTYEINNAKYVDSSLNKEDILIEFKVKAVKFSFNDNSYITENYCGFNDWVLNVEKDLTGLPCNNLLSTYDSFHTSFKSVDALEYLQLKRTGTSLWHPTAYSESGDSEMNARKSMLFEIPSN
jgi:hypothetical protein